MLPPCRNDPLADCSSRSGVLEDLKPPSLANQSTTSERRCFLNNGKTADVGIGHDSVTMYSPGYIKHTESADRITDTMVLRQRLSKICSLKDSPTPVPIHQNTSVAFTQLQDSVSSAELEPFLAQSIRKRDLFSWQTAVGIYDFQYNEQYLRHHGSETEEVIPEEEFSARVAFTPASNTSSKFQFLLDLSQKLTNGNNILSTPILSFRSIIPKTSDVFRIVQYGSVYELRKALSEGCASLTDCDSKGRSLLNVRTNVLG